VKARLWKVSENKQGKTYSQYLLLFWKYDHGLLPLYV